ncbi:MAG: Ldh family oxidoreductase [Alphaproteobacteria bacterium]|nr:Ldh family oxidoreductase [Alphaproteobacteria bacterium]
MSDLKDQIAALAARPRVMGGDLTAAVTAILAAAGINKADAARVGAALTDAQLRGSQSHGVIHLPVYVRGLLDGGINREPRMTMVAGTAVTMVIDADNGLGVQAGIFAVDSLVPLARRHGMAAAAMRNSNHFGVAGYFVERATIQGLIGLVFSNASPTVAPHGAAAPVLGTNPIAASFPLPGRAPIVIDMSTSAGARGRIRQAMREGKPIPADWSLDAQGQPTTDAAAAMAGTLLPMAGAKGYGLGLMAELLSSTLADGCPGYQVASPHEPADRPARVGHFFIVLDPAGFCGVDSYGNRAAAIAERLEATPRADGQGHVRLPGARGHDARHRAEREGIAMTKALAEALTRSVQQLDAATRGNTGKT